MDVTFPQIGVPILHNQIPDSQGGAVCFEFIDFSPKQSAFQQFPNSCPFLSTKSVVIFVGRMSAKPRYFRPNPGVLRWDIGQLPAVSMSSFFVANRMLPYEK